MHMTKMFINVNLIATLIRMQGKYSIHDHIKAYTSLSTSSKGFPETLTFQGFQTLSETLRNFIDPSIQVPLCNQKWNRWPSCPAKIIQ